MPEGTAAWVQLPACSTGDSSPDSQGHPCATVLIGTTALVQWDMCCAVSSGKQGLQVHGAKSCGDRNLKVLKWVTGKNGRRGVVWSDTDPPDSVQDRKKPPEGETAVCRL